MNFLFLVPLLIGFGFNSASAFTTYLSDRFGERGGRLACIILRDVVGIPVWATGYGMAVATNSPNLFSTSLFTAVFSGLLMAGGVGIIITGMLSLRGRAAAPSINDTLVVSGIYAHIRHPLYTGMLLELVGLFAWVPSHSVLAACTLGVAWVMLQARLEELDLQKRLPAYKEYIQRVPRFIPKLKI